MVGKLEEDDGRSVAARLVRQDEIQEKGYCLFPRPQRRRIRLTEVYEPLEDVLVEKSVKGRKRWALARVEDGQYHMKVYCMLSGDKLKNYQGWETFEIQAMIGGCYIVSNEMVNELKRYWKRSSVAELESMAVPEAKTNCSSLVLKIDRFNVIGLPPTPTGKRTLVPGGPSMTPVTPSKRKLDEEYKSPVKQMNRMVSKVRFTRQEFLPRTSASLAIGLFEPKPAPQELKIVTKPQPTAIKKIPLENEDEEGELRNRSCFLSSRHQIHSLWDQFCR
ncbi:hypothetical protein TRICI_003761 [Trichomonascus ciferrii]|uniref:Uncharacterized protein n=1 Tax=Trichomonascus ciferrii TaxID=44093 RepID=A0A642V322_9ASCO|nr:hypothetical protein TRICI_003761 [Trichomonascus ciferrii]